MENVSIEAATLRQNIVGEVEKCEDVGLLDLVYKLLVYTKEVAP
jgi:hypothetical protein